MKRAFQGLIVSLTLVTAVQAQRSAEMNEDIRHMIRAAHRLTRLMPWSGPVREMDQVVRHGKAIVPQLMILLPDDPDDPNLSYSDWHEQDIIVGKQFDWYVEQQAAVALCRIYQISVPNCPRYDVRALREDNKKIRAFWLKTIAEHR